MNSTKLIIANLSLGLLVLLSTTAAIAEKIEGSGTNPSADLPGSSVVTCRLELDGEPQTRKMMKVPVASTAEAIQISKAETSYGKYEAKAEVHAMNSTQGDVQISAHVTYELEDMDRGSVQVSGLKQLQVSMGSTQLFCEQE